MSLFATALQHEEILTEIRIPVPPARSGGAYFKLERKVGDFATAAVAAQLTLDEKGDLSKSGYWIDKCGPDPSEGTEGRRIPSRQEAG